MNKLFVCASPVLKEFCEWFYEVRPVSVLVPKTILYTDFEVKYILDRSHFDIISSLNTDTDDVAGLRFNMQQKLQGQLTLFNLESFEKRVAGFLSFEKRYPDAHKKERDQLRVDAGKVF